ncbi:HGR087Wp [Eremothecium sinecaudum]|uniref:HGR087Wp n=1 Tax=Eremothecium sinecaudum TaxID=45286 RepID=A0A109UY87_9SACH|nr:HGR087Wp [Eremothecium sinecaudum]AMD22426.1 HGR087Wp [Eremothecium sinecaudum]
MVGSEDFVGDSQSDTEQVIQIVLSDNQDGDEVHNQLNSVGSSDIESSSLDDDYSHLIDQESGVYSVLQATDPILQSIVQSDDLAPVVSNTPSAPQVEEDTMLATTNMSTREIDTDFLHNVKRFAKLHEHVNSSPSGPPNGAVDVIKQREKAIQSSIRNPVSRQLLDFLVRDQIGTTQDWYFFTEPFTYQESAPVERFLGIRTAQNLKQLYARFGAPSLALEPQFSITNCKQFHQLNNRVPVEIMCEEILRHVPKKGSIMMETSLRYFLLFLLDRKVFESEDLSMSWAENCWNKHLLEDKLDVYLSLVPHNYYFLHYRATRLLPIGDELLKRLLVGDTSSTALAHHFELLMDDKDWFQILYFLLFVNSTSVAMNSKTRTDHKHFLQYCKDCILDVNTHNVSSIELSLLKSYINLFIASHSNSH